MDLLSIANTTQLNKPHKIEELVRSTIDFYIPLVPGIDTNVSIFEPFLDVGAALSHTSESAQYFLYIEKLYEYIERFCLTTITKSKKQRLNKSDMNIAFRTIWIAVHELDLVKKKKHKYKVLDRTINILLQTIQVLDPLMLKLHVIVSKLAAYCRSEANQALVYSSMLTNLNNSDQKLISVLVSPKIKNTEKYDIFIQDLLNIYNNPSRRRQIPLLIFADNIIHGPDSQVSSEVILGLINDEMILSWVNNEEAIPKLCKLFINTQNYDNLMGKLSARLHKYSEISSLIEKLINAKELHDNLMKMTQFPLVINELSEALNAFDLYHSVVDVPCNYMEIDEELVKESILKINREIFRLINEFDSTDFMFLRFSYCCTAFFMLRSIPQVLVDELILTDYEPLLDRLMLPALQSFNPSLALECSAKAIILPHAKIESISVYEKFLAALKTNEDSDDIEWKLISVVSVSLTAKMFDDELFLKTLPIAYNFFVFNELDFSYFALIVINKLINEKDHYLARNTLNFCKDNFVFSKSALSILDKWITSYETDVKEFFTS